MELPPGVVPNYDDPPNMKALSLTALVLCLLFPIMAVAMRIYTKARVMHHMALEDYICCIAMVLFIAYYVPCILFFRLSPVVHIWDTRPQDLEPLLLYLHVGQSLYGVTIFFIKLAILLQYLKIFVHSRKANTVFWASHTLIWTNLVFYLVCSLLEIFGCTPIEKAWNPLITWGSCVDIQAITIASSAFNAVSNLIVFILPQKVIWQLQMSFKRRLGISIMFFTGIAAWVSSTMRIYSAVLLYQSKDVTFWGAILGLWSFPEMGFGIIIACLPCSPRFIQAVKYAGILTPVQSSIAFLVDRFTTIVHRRPGRYGTESQPSDGKHWQSHYAAMPEESGALGRKKMPSFPARIFARNSQVGGIVRTVHIETVVEGAVEDLEFGMGHGRRGPWDGNETHEMSTTISVSREYRL